MNVEQSSLSFWNHKFDEVWIDPDVAESDISKRFIEFFPEKVKIASYKSQKFI